MRKQLTTIAFILMQLILVATPLFAEQAAAKSYANGTLFGNVWLDSNGNGIYELSESPRMNVTIVLKTADGESVQSTTTDTDGNYFFTDLAYGEFEVWVNNMNNVLTMVDTVEIAEVNGTNSLPIPQTPQFSNPVFLPIITS